MTREEALKIIKNGCRIVAAQIRANDEETTKYNLENIEALNMAVEALEQEPKTGHWIIEIWNNREHYTCSYCQHVVDYEPCYRYCPYCGAKMEEELQWFDIA